MQTSFTDLSIFSVRDGFGRAGPVRGVHAPGLFTLRVVQQPVGSYTYISHLDDVVTQMQTAERYGVTGLIAHNYLAGRHFFRLRAGQEIQVILANKKVRKYQVSGIHHFQRMVPTCPTSDLVDLSNGDRLNYIKVFDRYYTGDHHLTLQTCLARNGLENFGLVFFTTEVLR